MKNFQKGFIVLILIVLAVLVLGGGTYYSYSKETPKLSVTEKKDAQASLYTNADYSFQIPKGWRVTNVPFLHKDELHLTNSKETDQEITATWRNGVDSNDQKTNNFLSSLITIYPAFYSGKSTHPIVGQPSISGSSTYETLLSVNGREVVYKFRTEEKKPQSGHADIKHSVVFKDGGIVNELFIIFPYQAIFSDSEARNFLASFMVN